MAQKKTRLDAYANTMSSLGSTKDKTTGLTFQRRSRLPRPTLEALYEQNAIVARVVDLKVEEAFRTGWKVVCDDVDLDNDEIVSHLSDLGVEEALRQLFQWGNLYGGAGVYIPVDDGLSPDLPVSMADIRSLHKLQTYAPPEIRPRDEDANFASSTFRQILNYDLTPTISARGTQTIHASRVISFEPIKLPRSIGGASVQFANDGWGPSIIERIWSELGWSGSAKQYSTALLYNASVLYFQMHGFRNAHKTAEGKRQIKQFLETARQTLDSLGIMGIDSDDALGSISLTGSGIHELIDRLDNALAASTDMPREILFNESPAGLNAGELSGPQEIWFAKVQAFRERHVTPALDRILELYFASRNIDCKSWKIEWEPLWTPSTKAKSEVAAQDAATDNIYWQMDAISSDEIREQRFDKGESGPLRLSAADEMAAPPLDLQQEVVAHEQSMTPTTSPSSASEDNVKVSDLAMNGAQVASLMQIVQNAMEGLLPRDAAIGIIGAAFPSLRGREATVLGSAGLQPIAPAAGVEPETDEPDEPAPAAYDPPAGETLQSPKDLAEALGVSAASIRSMHKRGEIGGWKVGGRWRFARSEILSAAHSPKPETGDAEIEK